MNARPAATSRLRHLIASIIIVVAGSSAARAADEPPAGPPAPSKEMRAQMAALHEKMAACLRSDKAFAECRDEMHKNCRDMMGEQGCPMMSNGMGMGMGMGMQNRMQPCPAPKPDDK
jgi:hypothetical protein